MSRPSGSPACKPTGASPSRPPAAAEHRAEFVRLCLPSRAAQRPHRCQPPCPHPGAAAGSGGSQCLVPDAGRPPAVRLAEIRADIADAQHFAQHGRSLDQTHRRGGCAQGCTAGPMATGSGRCCRRRLPVLHLGPARPTAPATRPRARPAASSPMPWPAIFTVSRAMSGAAAGAGTPARRPGCTGPRSSRSLACSCSSIRCSSVPACPHTGHRPN